MPSYYPFPSIASLSLSMLLTVKRGDRLARIVEVYPCEHARINDSFAGIYNALTDGYEGI